MMQQRTSPSLLSSSPLSSSSINKSGGDQEQIIQFIVRMFKWRQLDFKGAFRQMFELLVSPDLVYNSAENRKYIKDRYSRDDPSLVMILSAFMLIVGLIYSIFFHKLSLSNYISLIGYLLLFDFIFLGIVISTFTWLIGNKILSTSENENIEWLYSFDIHTNSFFPLFVLLYVAQFICLPLLGMNGFMGIILSDLLYMFSFSYYWFITFKGYLKLKFIKNSELFLLPIPIIVIITIICIASGVNLTNFFVSLYITN